MSKGYSGLFAGTKGCRNTQEAVRNSAYAEIVETIASRTKGLDLREHPLPYKIPSAKKMKSLKKKVDSGKATKSEYKLYDWAKRFNKRRNDGVKRFWRQERARLLRGEKGTRNWTEEQKNDIIHNKTPKFNGKIIVGHHSYSASNYPHLANLGEIIYPATFREHLRGWHGGKYKLSMPGRPIKIIIDF